MSVIGTDRRGFLIAAAALFATQRGQAQQSQVRRIGFLSTGGSTEGPRARKVILDSLARLGYKEGDNLIIEWRFAENKPGRLRDLAEELVRSKVELIMTTFNPATIAARNATRAIPIVMLVGSYPVENGFIAKHGRPGGNITGLDTWSASALTEKWYQVLKFAIPDAKVVVNLWGETSTGHGQALGRDFHRKLAQRVGLSLIGVELTPIRGLAEALDQVAALRPDLLAIEGSAVTNPHWPEIAAFALKQKLPSISVNVAYAQLGGLLSYGPDILDMLERTGSYVDRILRGANPAEMPVEQPTKFELVLNSKTAKAIGVTFQPSFLSRVDRIIE